MGTLSALGKRIHKLRQKNSITQEQLAEQAGISPKNLSEIENGRGNPTLTSLEGLAGALGISLSELFDFESEWFSVEDLRAHLFENLGKMGEEECRLYYRLLRVLTK